MAGVDMHIHTTASDGDYTPTEVVDLALKKGLQGIAITDHDSLAGIKAAKKAAQETDLLIIPGIELSTSWLGKGIHILGYNLDYEMPWLLCKLKEQQKERESRMYDILKKLKQHNIIIDPNHVKKISGSGVIGRPHIAKAMIEQNHVQSITEAFDNWLIKGAPAFVPRKKFTPFSALKLIINAGGIPVIAHPGVNDVAFIIPDLVKAGLLGVEAYHPKHSKKEICFFANLALKCGVKCTAGSDFHSRCIGYKTLPLTKAQDFLKSYDQYWN